ncbi:hypothetical protein AB1Y20_018448 [Prymnesium parvum]|uniref:Uncharacterized protein n=1 Tax=Prymnesium parvum TaxID=97485 RepID=A0AB34JPY1_PRYPA
MRRDRALCLSLLLLATLLLSSRHWWQRSDVRRVAAPFLISLSDAHARAHLPSLDALPELIPDGVRLHDAAWARKDWRVPEEAAALTALLYDVERTVAYSAIPPQMRRKLEASGRAPHRFAVQQCVTIGGRFLSSEALSFNRVRSLRFTHAAPKGAEARGGHAAAEAGEGVEVAAPRQRELVASLDQQSCQPADLCDPLNWTMADASIGYLQNERAVAFANMGRVTALHGVVVARHVRSPLRLKSSDLRGMFALAHAWFLAARAAHGAAATFPTLSFDSLRTGGASMLHPHLQTRLGRRRYAGKWQGVRDGAARYAELTGRPYHQDVAAAHAFLGLHFVRTDHFVGYLSLTSAGAAAQVEIVGDTRAEELLSSARGATLAVELGAVFYRVLRAAHAELGWDGFSASCALPPLDGGGPGGMPWICRMVGRGSYDSVVSDISANELFELPVVPIDLLDAASRLRRYLLSVGLSAADRSDA